MGGAPSPASVAAACPPYAARTGPTTPPAAAPPAATPPVEEGVPPASHLESPQEPTTVVAASAGYEPSAPTKQEGAQSQQGREKPAQGWDAASYAIPPDFNSLQTPTPTNRDQPPSSFAAVASSPDHETALMAAAAAIQVAPASGGEGDRNQPQHKELEAELAAMVAEGELDPAIAAAAEAEAAAAAKNAEQTSEDAKKAAAIEQAAAWLNDAAEKEQARLGGRRIGGMQSPTPRADAPPGSSSSSGTVAAAAAGTPPHVASGGSGTARTSAQGSVGGGNRITIARETETVKDQDIGIKTAPKGGATVYFRVNWQEGGAGGDGHTSEVWRRFSEFHAFRKELLQVTAP